MIMKKIYQHEIIDKISETDELTAVEIIRNHKNTDECSIIINDTLMSIGYETRYSKELVNAIKKIIDEDILLIQFDDNELSEAWKQSYLKGGISEDRHDRRVIPHAYNDMNELYCIDRNLLYDITDKWVGTEWENTCKWKVGIIDWYKNHLI